jgi:hypothetical protein
MKLLFIGEKQEKVLHGWDHGNKKNQVILEEIFDVVNYIPLDSHSLKGKVFIGITNSFLKKLDEELSKGYDYVFVCQSTCGRVCKHIKLKYPFIKIITFFHNIERQYAEQYLKVSGIKAIPYFIRAFVFERMAAKYSDYCVVLNDRESNLLNKFYGKYADAVMPLSLEDRFQPKDSVTDKDDVLIDYLFVGTAFYPNIEGVQWFIDNVMPKVSGTFIVVGKDMKESLFSNMNDRVHVYGFVDDLSDFYRRAKTVVSPIFHGGGMKTKTAEALMYGKRVLGTKEALEGYVLDSDSIVECNTAEEFIYSLSSMDNSDKTFYEESRNNFLQYCSYESSKRVLIKMLG